MQIKQDHASLHPFSYCKGQGDCKSNISRTHLCRRRRRQQQKLAKAYKPSSETLSFINYYTNDIHVNINFENMPSLHGFTTPNESHEKSKLKAKPHTLQDLLCEGYKIIEWDGM